MPIFRDTFSFKKIVFDVVLIAQIKAIDSRIGFDYGFSTSKSICAFQQMFDFR